MKFYIKTLGCKVNQSESDKLASDLIKRGLSLVDSSAKADLVFLNTCTVTSTADSKARQLISKTLKDVDSKVFVIGCAVNNIDSGIKKFSDIEYVNQEDKSKIAQRFGPIVQNNHSNVKRSRPLVKIQDGCDHQCSYCIVPTVRGGSKSPKMESIKKEVSALLNNGFQEIVLTGVDIGAYSDNGNRLDSLLEQLLALDPHFRIRLSSLEPQSVTERFLDLYTDELRLCSHIHLPLQSGSEHILKLMNRPYGSSQFLDLAHKLKSLRKDIALTTDVIVGFPDETNKDFKLTKQIVKSVGFAKVHIFPYSERPQTPASNLNDKISPDIKKQRVQELSALAKKLSDDFKRSLVNKKAQVLIERQAGNYLKGVTSNYCHVYFAVDGDGSFISKGTVLLELVKDCPLSTVRTVPKGKLANAKIERFKEGQLFGTLV